MEGVRTKPSFFLCSLIFLASAALSGADIPELDDHWQKKAEEALARSRAAYHPDPEAVTNHFNKAVHLALAEARNSTRRSLRAVGVKKFKGKCVATNPIDRCWRCQKNWIKHRKKLATCGKGFGRHATGGKAGDFYVVTDPSDDDLVNPKFGTLRWGVIQDRPLWIVFARDMIIRLSEELMINSNKTIDARGANVHIAYGAQITIQFVNNVIIHGLHIHDIKPSNGGMIRDSLHHFGLRTKSDGDGISIYGSSDVWIDHCSMRNCADGLIDAIEGSTAITISNCHFTHHNDVLLFGASDSNENDSIMQATVAFNHFGKGLVQRMPRCRWGFFHVVNNDYTHWMMYAIGGSKHPTIISQGNRFIAPPLRFAKEVTKEVTKRDYATEDVWKQWTWRSEGDLMQNGAFFASLVLKHKDVHRKDFIRAKPGTWVRRLTRFAGPLGCKAGRAC
uniref:Pectate lyase n=1 Tax=Elaeis guineensis var. tenera TaxID=51953 RepID=A1KXJ5_ELAGV|nr:oil palm polygalacturonase allergen PEST411 [Elaeis guineensis]